MKKNYLLLIISFLAIHFATAQSLAINTDGSTADASALLDVKSIQKGILIPRMTKAERTTIASPVTGLLVFQNAPDSMGFYYYDGSTWNWMAAINGNADSLAWKRNGNAGTTSLHFIGTTDDQPLNFRQNGQWMGKWNTTTGNYFIGAGAGINITGNGSVAMGDSALNTATAINRNVAIGDHALFRNTDRGYIIGIGDSTLYNNGIGAGNSFQGINNIAIGSKALYSNTIGSYNIALGTPSMNLNTTGTVNTAIGAFALNLNTTGSQNIAIGYATLLNNTTATQNVGVGTEALRNTTTGSYNTAVGRTALLNNTTGASNTAVGNWASYFNSSAYSNVALGAYALFTNRYKSNLVAVGDSALFNNNDITLTDPLATGNTAVGSKSLHSNTIGYYNTAIGFNSMKGNTSGNNNTAAGYVALITNVNGTNNTAIGSNALNVANGLAHTAIGAFALSKLTGSNYNVAIGDSAARNLVSGSNNVIIGAWSFKDHTAGSRNTAIGNFAMGDRESGDDNTAVGEGSLWNTNSNLNTGIGKYAGYQNISGTNNTYLGANAYASFDNLTNSTAIGANSNVNASNKVRIGSSTVTVIEGQVAYTFPSDGRFKTAVTESVRGLDFIKKLRPVIYNFQTEKYDAFIRGEENKDQKPTSLIDYSEAEKIRHSGFIAQEVVNAAREAGYEFDGVVVPKNSRETYGLSYSQFVVPLVKAVQEQQQEIDELKKQIQELRAALNK